MESCRVVGVNPFNLQDAVKNMREVDEFEFTILGETKEQAVQRCIALSDEVHVMAEESTNKPVWVWGFGQEDLQPRGYDCVWGFGTDLMRKHKWQFIDRMTASCNLRLERSRRLTNYVWENNHAAIKGLGLMGFTVMHHVRIPIGERKVLFIPFTKEAV